MTNHRMSKYKNPHALALADYAETAHAGDDDDITAFFYRIVHAMESLEADLKAERTETETLRSRVQELESIINTFEQVCPQKHPYLFATTELDCPDCAIERVEAALEVIDNTEWATLTGNAPCSCYDHIRKALKETS